MFMISTEWFVFMSFWKTIIDFTGPWAIPESMLFLSNHGLEEVKQSHVFTAELIKQKILRPFINN